MFRKRKVKKKDKISVDLLSKMIMDRVKEKMIQSGIATADQISVAEIEIQKKESVNNGKVDYSNTDRIEDVLES